MNDDASYLAYVRAAQAKQRSYIKAEMRRIDAAHKLWMKYAAGMSALGLHVLKGMEIEDRRCELRQMLDRIEETHCDSPVMRWAFQEHEKEVAALVDIGYTRSSALYELANRRYDGSDVAA